MITAGVPRHGRARKRRWGIAAAIGLMLGAAVAWLLVVRADRLRARARGGRVFRVALPNGEDRTVIVRPAGGKEPRDVEWHAW